jgi:hypothetical protein
MKPLAQKTKDRLMVIGVLALEAFLIFGSVSNFYRYIFLKISIDLLLAIFSTIAAAILFLFIIWILVSYFDKRKLLNSLKE